MLAPQQPESQAINSPANCTRRSRKNGAIGLNYKMSKMTLAATMALMVLTLHLTSSCNATKISNSTLRAASKRLEGQNTTTIGAIQPAIKPEPVVPTKPEPTTSRLTIENILAKRKAIAADKKEARKSKLNRPKLSNNTNSTDTNSIVQPAAVNITLPDANLTAKADPNNGTDHKTSDSLLRPLFLSRLLTGRRFTGGGLLTGGLSAAPEEEEEEEVTKTIMMPMTEAEHEQHQQSHPDKSQSSSQSMIASPEQEVEQVVAPSEATEEEMQQVDEGILKEPQVKGEEFIEEAKEPVASYPLAEQGATRAATTSTKVEDPPTRVPKLEEHPKPEESLRLSRTEMNNLLLDGEGPESYRERERHGEGVLIGEEQPPTATSPADSQQLGTAASNGFDSHHRHAPMSGYPSAGFEGESFGTPRLSPEASESYGPGFNHRFGHSSYEDHSGRLMQSPNEYSEFSAGHGSSDYPSEGHGYSSGFSSSGGRHGGHAPHHDYSPHSGLVRASSGDHFGGHPHAGLSPESSHYEHFPTRGYHSAGYPGGGRLEQHPSEHYGSGEHHHSPADDSLHGHGGYHSSSYGDGGRLTSAGSHSGYPHSEGHYSGYEDHYSGRPFGGYERRGFASQQNEISMRSTEHQPASSLSSSMEPGKLMPLSATIPTPDEVSAASSANEAVDNKEPAGGQRTTTDSEEPQPQPREQEESNQQANEQPSAESEEQHSSQQQQQQQTYQQQQQRQPVTYESAVRQVEFARIGSAGFLAPSVTPTGGERHSETVEREPEVERQQRQRSRQHLRQQQVIGRQPYDPADNPAHAGKYIID